MSLPTLTFRRANVTTCVKTYDELVAEIERITTNSEARERFLKREGNLLRAVERERDDLLREVEDLRMMRDEHLIDNQNAIDEGRSLERGDVVAWLWGQSVRTHDYAGTGDPVSEVYASVARALERGDHLRNGEKP